MDQVLMRISWPPLSPARRQFADAAAEIVCPVSESGEFVCRVPSASLDIRLRVATFAPVYRWASVVPEEGGLDLGNIHLVAGASLTGWLEVRGPGIKGAEPSLRLLPVAQGQLPTASGLESRSLEGKPAASGFFQLRGLTPGAYSLEASLEGLGTARVSTVILHPGEETRLPEPLILEPPARLEVALSPATDAYGKPWVLRLVREDPHAHFMETLAQGSPGQDGLWRAGPLERGAVALEVGDSQGSVWLEEQLTLVPDSNEVFLEVPLIPIEGTVVLGDEPVAGRLWFGGRRRVPNVVVDLDEAGRFAGHLPREGTWAVDLESEGGDAEAGLEQALEPVEVRVPEGKSVAEIEIRLPETELRGRVVDDQGEGAPGATLVAVGLRGGEKKRREILARAGADGSFRFRGVSPGRLALQARKGSADSGWQEIHLMEGFDHPEVTLRLEELLAVRGRVTDGGGGVGGAAVLAVASSGSFQRTVTTGPDGSFRLNLRDEPVDLAVSALGRGFRLLRVDPRRAQGQLLDLDLTPPGGRLVLDVGGAFAAGSQLDGLRLVRGRGPQGASVSLVGLLRDLRLPVGEELSRLEIESAEAGDWTFCNSSGDCLSSYLAPGGLLVLGHQPPSDGSSAGPDQGQMLRPGPPSRP